MLKTVLPLVLLACSLSACSALGPYTYDDYSAVRIPQALNPQVPVHAVSGPPLSAVCHLRTARRNIKKLWLGKTYSVGSAALVQGRYLITAAHNVYDYPLNNLMSLDVSCGAVSVSGDTVNVRLQRDQIVQDVHVPRYEFKLIGLVGKDRRYEYDYAFVDLGQTVGPYAGFSVSADVQVKEGSPLFFAGYPGGLISNGATLYQKTSVVDNMDANLMSYPIRTATGNSGGPVWITAGGSPVLVAVHVRNSTARVIDDRFLADWTSWLNARNQSFAD